MGSERISKVVIASGNTLRMPVRTGTHFFSGQTRADGSLSAF